MLFDASFLTSASRPAGFPADTGREVAVVGRSNSGKSSAINALLGRRKLARVSRTPGRTQLINFFDLGDDRRLVDLPGYGFAQVPDTVRDRWRELVTRYFERRRALRGLFVTVDARRGLTELDTMLLDWVAGLDIGVALLLTKTDKLGRGAVAKRRDAVRAAAPGVSEVIAFSVPARIGIDAARATLEAWLAQAAAVSEDS